MVARVLIAVSLLSSAMAYADEDFSKHNKDILLSDYLKIEGTYNIKTQYQYLDLKNEKQAYEVKSINLFVLIYDARLNRLVGSLTSGDSFLPLIVFDDLKSEYAADKSKIVLRGFEDGAVYGQMDVVIDVATGEISGQFKDGHAAGKKVFGGQRDLSLWQFFDTALGTSYLGAPAVTNLQGLYLGQPDDTEHCGRVRDSEARLAVKNPINVGPITGSRACVVYIVVRRFDDDTLTASIVFSRERLSGKKLWALTWSPFVGGVYNQALGALEFTSMARATNVRLRSKLNLKMSRNGAMRAFIYGTCGVQSSYTLTKISEVLD